VRTGGCGLHSGGYDAGPVRDRIRQFVLPTPHSFHPPSLVGTTFDGRYRIVEHLATGGMGAVFRAEHVYMRKQLAVKVLRPELSVLPDLAERFRREAEIAASLEHENIVRVTDFGRTIDGWLFLVMELLDGESLHERMAQGIRMEAVETVRILVQICRGLDAAHRRGVVHRDLKPENVFLTRPAGSVKLLDFGIAKLSDPALPGQTQAGIVVGTPEYLSPEQASGGAVDRRADLYSVGLIAWRMLAGHHPFAANDARGLILAQATQPLPSLIAERPDLAEWGGLVGILERACAKDPADRHSSAAELAADLEACVPPSALAAAFGATVAPTSHALLPAPRIRRRRFLRPVVLVPLVALAATAVFAGASAYARWAEQRPIEEARELIAANRFEAARDVVARALVKRPHDARLLLLHGEALHRIDGQAQAALRAYAAALDADATALDAAALADLQADLRDPALAQEAGQLLARAGDAAVPLVIAAARAGPATSRLRALDLARQIGAEDRFDNVAEYAALLEDPDCNVRKIAVSRLAEVGTPGALEKLAALARQSRQVRGLFGFPQNIPVCGAAEAAAALKKTGHHSDP